MVLDISAELLGELRQEAVRRGRSDGAIIEQCLRAGLTVLQRAAFPYRQRTYSMGVPLIDIDKANAVAESLEGEEYLRRFRRGGREE
jgi:hypothetical protein